MERNNIVKEKISFLIVENSPKKRQAFMSILQELGYEHFYEASDGAAAFNLLRRRTVEIIISAWDMPQMNGLALLKVVSSDENFYMIPFIFVIPTIDRDMVVEAGKRGVAAIFIEPIRKEEIEKKLVSILSGGEVDENELKVEILLNKAKKLSKEKKYNEALAVYREIIEAHESAEVFFNIGNIKSAQGKYDEAIIAFRKAVMIDNLHARAFKEMGDVYLKKDEPQEAEKCFEKAGKIFMERNQDKEAEIAFKEVLRLNPDTVNIYNDLGILYRKQKRFDDAINNYRLALKVDPEDENIYFNLGRAHLENMQVVKARKMFEHALALDPDMDEAKRMLQAIDVGF